jgi:dihydrofolate reductase
MKLIRQSLRENLIDEIGISVHPFLFRGCIPPFPPAFSE